MLLFLNEPLRIVSAKCTLQKQTNLLRLKAIAKKLHYHMAATGFCACTPERSEWTYLWDIFLRLWALWPRDTPAAVHTPVWPPFGRSYVNQTVRYIFTIVRASAITPWCEQNRSRLKVVKERFFYKRRNSKVFSKVRKEQLSICQFSC